MTNPFDGAAIAFDLDGTLVDTAPDLVTALNAALAEVGQPPFALPIMRAMVGQGARALLERAGRARAAPFDDSMLDHLTERFIVHYQAAIAVGSQPFPGCIEALERLQALGAVLCVCTNKRTDLSERLLSDLGMRHHFAAVVGADKAPNKKPHPDHLRAALLAAGASVARSVMVGDSSADINAAIGLGCPSIAVSFGYADAPVATLGASSIIDHFDDLIPALQKLLGPQR